MVSVQLCLCRGQSKRMPSKATTQTQREELTEKNRLPARAPTVKSPDKKRRGVANKQGPRKGLGIGACFGIGGECIGLSGKLDVLAGSYSIGLTGNGVVNGVNFRWHPNSYLFGGYTAHFLLNEDTAALHSLSLGCDIHLKKSYIRLEFSHNYSPSMNDFPQNSGSISWMFRTP